MGAWPQLTGQNLESERWIAVPIPARYNVRPGVLLALAVCQPVLHSAQADG